jgi:predicted nucleotidyltransferase
MDFEILVRKIEQVFNRMPEISLGYLFGSRFEGRQGPLSDYDWAVLVDWYSLEKPVQAILTHELASILQTSRIDVVILNRAPIELAYHVIAQGKLIYSRDIFTRVEYEANVLGRYGDYLPVLRAERHQILEGDAHAVRVQRYRTTFGRTERTLSAIRSSSR